MAIGRAARILLAFVVVDTLIRIWMLDESIRAGAAVTTVCVLKPGTLEDIFSYENTNEQWTVTWHPFWHLVSSKHSSLSKHWVPVGSSWNPRGHIHLKLPRVLMHCAGGKQAPGCSTHSFTSVQKFESSMKHKRHYQKTTLLLTYAFIVNLRVSLRTRALVASRRVDALVLAVVLSSGTFIQIPTGDSVGVENVSFRARADETTIRVLASELARRRSQLAFIHIYENKNWIHRWAD